MMQKYIILLMQATSSQKNATIIRQNKKLIRANLKIKVKNSLSKLEKNDAQFDIAEDQKKKQKFLNLADVRSSKDKVIEEDFDYYFEKLEKIGEGCHSVVYLCKNRLTSQKLAVKITRKKDLEHFQDIRQSFLIMKKLNHQNILKADFLFMNQQLMTCHLVSQYCQYSDLKDYIMNNKSISQVQCAYIIQEVLRTLAYIHQKGVCHRDIKPDNILYNPQTKKIKIIDFQLSRMSKYIHQPLQMLTKVGPINYRAPQTFLNLSYDQKIDIWATGVMTYQLLTGKSPFNTVYQTDKIKMICNQDPEFDKLPLKAKRLVQQMLQKNPKIRITASQSLHSKFFLVHNESPHILLKSKHSRSMKILDSDIEIHRHHKSSHDTDCTEDFQGDLDGEDKVIRCSKKTP